jgi:hypothetical protein
VRTPTNKNTPKVGIIYLVGEKLLIDSTPLAKAGRYGDHLIHEGDHISFWTELLNRGEVPHREYEELPRGRMAYDARAGKFELLADKCILDRKRVVAKIFAQLGIPAKDSEVGLDSHYRCFRCLRRGH